MSRHATPRLLRNGDTAGRPQGDLYDRLADEFHLGAGQMLDEVLRRHALPLAQRREIVGEFLFRLMASLDDASPCALDPQGLDDAEGLARSAWVPSLAFLRHDEAADGECGALRDVLVCEDTWLHEVCGDPLDAWFDAQARPEGQGHA